LKRIQLKKIGEKNYLLHYENTIKMIREKNYLLYLRTKLSLHFENKINIREE